MASYVSALYTFSVIILLRQNMCDIQHLIKIDLYHNSVSSFEYLVIIKLMKVKALRKHILHGKIALIFVKYALIFNLTNAP